MALVLCHECGRQVSTEALACPQCGAPPKSSISSPKSHAEILSKTSKAFQDLRAELEGKTPELAQKEWLESELKRVRDKELAETYTRLRIGYQIGVARDRALGLIPDPPKIKRGSVWAALFWIAVIVGFFYLLFH
jgi:hypothetical protein